MPSPRRVIPALRLARPVAATLATALVAALLFADPIALGRVGHNLAVVLGSVVGIVMPLGTLGVAALGWYRAAAKPRAAPPTATATPTPTTGPAPTFGGGMTLREILDAHDNDMGRLDVAKDTLAARDREIATLRARLDAASTGTAAPATQSGADVTASADAPARERTDQGGGA